MSKFQAAARKAVATFVFATTGTLIGVNIMALDVAAWQAAAMSGLGALINLAYRWSEAVLRERGSEG